LSPLTHCPRCRLLLLPPYLTTATTSSSQPSPLPLHPRHLHH
jgi:hypothetical protein